MGSLEAVVGAACLAERERENWVAVEEAIEGPQEEYEVVDDCGLVGEEGANMMSV